MVSAVGRKSGRSSLADSLKAKLLLLKFTRYLAFRKSGTGCLFAVTGAAALDIHMLCNAFIIAVINTFHCFTVNTDHPVAPSPGTAIDIPALSSWLKAFTAGFFLLLGILSAHHNITLTAKSVLIIGTIFYCTF